eukprot:TRINITY_DN4267_c0_g1_i1.p1 TRINITY_DN4267_c0_g1~~TRINITY_DN4267_c0_g1_i1.p1  ORF type:complete len:146 (-),score=44.33 TRINITY_DN4267_c0_g1_i1:233-670(-)
MRVLNALRIPARLRAELVHAVGCYEERAGFVPGIAGFSQPWAPFVTDFSTDSRCSEEGSWSHKAPMTRRHVEEAGAVLPAGALEAAFRELDASSEERIPVAKLHSVLTSLGDVLTGEEAAELGASVDLDGDGTVSCQEFVEYLRS